MLFRSILFNQFYDNSSQYFKPKAIPALVSLIAKYQYQNAFAANAEINFSAFIAEIMLEDLEMV